MAAKYENSMQKLIPVINRLQDVLTTVGSDMIDLPQIVVVGSQSSGKSSVLESIVGRDFLPRGSGIVTRRPLVLQLLHRAPEEGDKYSEWGEFLHKPGEEFSDYKEICGEIEEETSRVVGNNKGISSHAIHLKIYSPNVVNLTMVDLPGITKVPVGDQPSDIEKQIRRMIVTYIEKPNTLILAVTAANTDLANSDALQLARLVDPDCQRTIGVLTKLDLMDRGTNALEILNGEVIPLKLGFIGVVNRSQADINESKDISSAIESEKQFFIKHVAYRNIAHRLGCKHLANTLNKLLMAHIKNCLPILRQRIHAMSVRAQQELAALGNPVEDASNMGGVILEIITKFSQDYKSAIEGSQTTISTTELYGGARISYIFHELFYVAIERIDPCAGLSIDDIRTVIRNATGTRGALFVPEVSFELLVKRAIGRLKEPAMQCVNLVYEELMKLLSQYESKELQRFTALREHLHNTVSATLERCLKPTYSMVSNLINIELAYINTRHPEFVRNIPSSTELHSFSDDIQASHSAPPSQQAARKAPAPSGGSGGGFFGMFGGGAQAKGGQVVVEEPPAVLRSLNPPDAREKMESELIRNLLAAYFAIVKKSIQDGVPKTIMHFLVNNATSHMQSELVKALYNQDLFDKLLSEPEELTHRRKHTKDSLTLLKKAEEILSEIRDFGW